MLGMCKLAYFTKHIINLTRYIKFYSEDKKLKDIIINFLSYTDKKGTQLSKN